MIKAHVSEIKTLFLPDIRPYVFFQIYAGCEDGHVRMICEITGNIFKTLKVVPNEKPVAGLSVFRERSFLKLITWHEGGIEMRTVSLEKYPPYKEPAKKYFKTARQKKLDEEKKMKEEPRMPRRTRYFKILPQKNLRGTENKPKPHKFRPLEEKEKLLEERCCTVLELRNTEVPVKTFTSDVFTEMVLADDAMPFTNMRLETYPRLQQDV